MAITYVSNALGATNSTTSFSITLPATEANDIIVLEFTHRGTGNGTIGGTYDGPAFTQKHDQLYATSTFSGKTLYSRATGNHSGQTVTGSGLTNSCAAIVTIYRGAVTTGDPLADATIVGEQNALGDETQAEITTATAEAWVVLVVANSPDVAVSTQACTSPVLAERAERLSTGGIDTSISHASGEKATAGATGAFTWAQSNRVGGSWAYAIVPAPPPSGIAFDTSTDVGANSGVGVNATISASTTFLVVHGIGNTSNGLTAATATAGGTPMVQIGTIVAGNNKYFAFGLMNPPTGTISIVITLTGDTTHLSRATSYTGSKTTGQPAQSNEGTTGSGGITTTALTLATNSWLIGGFRNDGAAISGGSSTKRTPDANNVFTGDSGGPVSGSQTLNFTNGNSGGWGYHSFELEVAAPSFQASPMMHQMMMAGGLM